MHETFLTQKDMRSNGLTKDTLATFNREVCKQLTEYVSKNIYLKETPAPRVALDSIMSGRIEVIYSAVIAKNKYSSVYGLTTGIHGLLTHLEGLPTAGSKELENLSKLQLTLGKQTLVVLGTNTVPPLQEYDKLHTDAKSIDSICKLLDETSTKKARIVLTALYY